MGEILANLTHDASLLHNDIADVVLALVATIPQYNGYHHSIIAGDL